MIGLIHAGALTVRLAASAADIRAAQALRHQVFYEERGATPGADMPAGLDRDDYDDLCDHLLVIDKTNNRIVGTYRLLQQRVAEAHRGFYSAAEYDLSPLLDVAEEGQLLELGRSCVAADHRNAATIALLWRGIASYLEVHRIRAMFGCASFPGIDPTAHAVALSYLAHHHAAPGNLNIRALPEHYVEMERLPLGSYDVRAAARSLPPLIKGYLRVGAMIGDGAFIDRQFNTVDVFVLMPVEAIAARYSERFRRAA
jgi:L-ornithine Nalpha-acyltransferase